MSPSTVEPTEAVVFAGLSVAAADVRARLARADIRGPIARGDIEAIADVRTIVIIDGVFHHTLAISPGEIRAGLRRGHSIYGSSSMGALRAAELWPLGMHGVGRIFEWYRDGILEADAEVALVFDPETFRPLSRARVCLRFALTHARALLLLTDTQCDQLMSWAMSRPYAALTTAAIAKAWREAGGPADIDVGAFLDAHDLKRLDALACLDQVSTHLAAPPHHQ